MLEPGSILILNDQHAYSVEVDAPVPMETLCVFFRRGYVEDLARVATTADDRLLDEAGHIEPYRFVEAPRRDDEMTATLAKLRTQVRREAASEELDRTVVELAEQMVLRDRGLRALSLRIPAIKASTREELLRRVIRARDFVDASLASSLPLETVASAAALSPITCTACSAALSAKPCISTPPAGAWNRRPRC